VTRGTDLHAAAVGVLGPPTSTRAPYFHDGSAATLMDVVNFYDLRFSIGLSAQDKIDLVNFLNAL
jgi:cytochrome c peroxidase